MNFFRWLAQGWPKPVVNTVIDHKGRFALGGQLRDIGYIPDPRFPTVKPLEALKGLEGYLLRDKAIQVEVKAACG